MKIAIIAAALVAATASAALLSPVSAKYCSGAEWIWDSFFGDRGCSFN